MTVSVLVVFGDAPNPVYLVVPILSVEIFHMLSFIFVAFFASSHGELRIPVGEYCAKVYGPYVSKLVSSPAGTVSVYLAGQTTTVSIKDAAYLVDETTGMININTQPLKYGAQKFPYIAHLWNMRYDSTRDEVQLFSPATSGHIPFQSRCDVTPGPLIPPRPEGHNQNPLNQSLSCSLKHHASLTFVPGYGLYGELKINGTSVSLYNAEYRTVGPNSRGDQLISILFPGHTSAVTEFPHVGYYFQLKYRARSNTLLVTGPPIGVGVKLTCT